MKKNVVMIDKFVLLKFRLQYYYALIAEPFFFSLASRHIEDISWYN